MKSRSSFSFSAQQAVAMTAEPPRPGEHGPVGLFGHLACFQDELLLPDF